MKYNGVTIESVTCVLPPRVVSSADIEDRLTPVYDRLKLPHGRLELMTGIRERRFWQPGTAPSAPAAEAGRAALEEAAVAPADIDCLVHAAVCRDFLEPATASVIHERLQLPKSCAIFDLGNACLGVLNAMNVVATLIETGQIETGLVVTGETAEPLHEATIEAILSDESLTRQSFKSHFASLTIASGAAAVVLSSEKRGRSGHRLLGGAVRTDTSSNRLCREDTRSRQAQTGPLMSTDSEALLHAGIALAHETWEEMKSELGWSDETPDHIFTHQVGSAHRKLLFERCGLDPQKDFPTVGFLGNTGSAALPGAWALGCAEKTINACDNIALMGIGSGLSSLMMGVRW